MKNFFLLTIWGFSFIGIAHAIDEELTNFIAIIGRGVFAVWSFK